jgi:hypothetical protein
MGWPPRNLDGALSRVLAPRLSPGQKTTFLAAARASYPPLLEAIDDLHRCWYLEDENLAEDEAIRRLVAIAEQWQAEVDV